MDEFEPTDICNVENGGRWKWRRKRDSKRREERDTDAKLERKLSFVPVTWWLTPYGLSVSSLHGKEGTSSSRRSVSIPEGRFNKTLVSD